MVDVFEQPLSERYRVFLRLEQVFARIDHHLAGESIWDTHAAIATVLELLQTVSRGDTKLELIKELDRQRGTLARFDEDARPGIDRERLQRERATQERLLGLLHSRTGALAAELRQNELLNQLQQRATAGGRPGIIEMPGYQRWLQRDPGYRHTEVRQWLQPLEPAREAIDSCLALVRETVNWQTLRADGGFYERILESGHGIQLLRLRHADASATWFPEVSAGRQRFSIRFFDQSTPAERAVQRRDDIDFELACCGL